MKYFPVKIVIFCILFTPVVYTFTLKYLEKYLSAGAYQHGSTVANAILIIYILFSLSMFFIFYRVSLANAKKHEAEKENLLNKLLEEEKLYQNKLDSLEFENKKLTEQYQTIRSECEQISSQANITENEMLEEIIALEKRLNDKIISQKETEEKIEYLQEELAKEDKRKGGNKKRKAFDVTAKRFAALYKNVDMNRKALIGICELNDEMQIKAEELIHQLNDDSSKITIKRKVFVGKKNKTASFEVLFSYSGRLYFKNIEGNRIEVLIIGTKNSQDKDMEFLHELS